MADTTRAKSNHVQEALSQAVLDRVDSGIEDYEKTGLHVSFDEVRDWAKSVRLNRNAPLPVCHIKFSETALLDLQRLHAFLEQIDPRAAANAVDEIL